MSDEILGLMGQADRARRENRLGDAHRLWSDAVGLCRSSNSRPNLVRTLKGLGQIERDLRHGDEARALYEEAAALCRQEGDALLLAHTVRHLGDIHQDAGRLDLAEPCYDEALRIYREHAQTRPLDLANTIRPLAALKTRAGAVEEAARLWKEARDLYALVNVREGVVECSKQLPRLNPSP